MASRREFLQHSSLLGFGTSVPTFLGRTAIAAPTSEKAGAKETILVVVQLTGGNDGLNTVIPFKNTEYYKLRPNIGISKDSGKKLTDDIALHPGMGELATLFTEKAAVCIVQGVGYPNPSQSHFRSMDIWNAGRTDEKLTDGWIGRSLRTQSLPAFHLASGNENAPLALSGAPIRVPSLTALEDFQMKTASSSRADQSTQKGVIRKLANNEHEPQSSRNPNSARTSRSLLDFVSRTQMNTYASSDKLAAIGKNYQPKVPYPNTGLARRLKLAAQLIDAGIGARIFYVSLDGFDTHAGQGGSTGTHADLLQQVSDSIAAFYRDLAARGHQDRLCVMTFSEFGRRAGENGSKGTDHGSGAPMFLIGGKVKSGIHGEHPSLTTLEAGNLIHHTDFRGVYAAVLESWLGIESQPILGQEYQPLDVFTQAK